MDIQRDAKAAEGRPLEELITLDSVTGVKVLPHWVAQPYTRPLLDVNGKKLNKAGVAAVDGVEPAGNAILRPLY